MKDWKKAKFKDWVSSIIDNLAHDWTEKKQKVWTEKANSVISQSLGEVIKQMFAKQGIKPSADYAKFINDLTDTVIKARTAEGQESIGTYLLTIPIAVASIFGICNALSESFLEKDVQQPLRQKFRPTFLEPLQILESERRKFITPKESNEMLSLLGYPDNAINALKRIQYFTPSGSDIITMAVKEVFSPEIATVYGQFDEGDKVYGKAKDYIEAVGMTKETFINYWAAHWELPSYTQGCDMLHRGIITEQELTTLLRSLDVMPYWRDKLIKLSYNPLTRVDVRRMHSMGVLTDAELIKAYKDIGYTEANAQKLAQFTKKLNDKDDPDKQKVKDLTVSAILKSYKLMVITEADAKERMKKIGVKTDVISIYIDTANAEINHELMTKRMTAVGEQYTKGTIDRAKAQGLLAELKMPQYYIDKMLETWDIERKIKTKRPSEAEFEKWYLADVISESRLRQEYSIMGYNDEYINFNMQYLSKKKNGTAK